ncbi:MAG: helix-turn-helix domain-containing protein [Deltaproteobacteria bacterium]|nr:helix-turn-helix domain-containing protein [Deltaproteobacteria bacterium]
MPKTRRAHLSYAELAALLRVPDTTVRYWAHMQTMPIIKIGRRAFIERETVVAMLAKAGSRIGDHNLDEVLEAHVNAPAPVGLSISHVGHIAA